MATYTLGTGASSKQSQAAGTNGQSGKWTSGGFIAAKSSPAPKVAICWNCGQPKSFGHALVCKGSK